MEVLKKAVHFMVVGSVVVGCATTRPSKDASLTEARSLHDSDAVSDTGQGPAASLSLGDDSSAGSGAVASGSEGGLEVGKPLSSSATEKISTSVTVKSVALKPDGAGSQQVVVGLSGQSPFELARTAPSEYVLTLPGATLGSEDIPPVMSPSGSKGIRTARVVRDGDKILVRMFVDVASSLYAEPLGGEIVIRSLGTSVKRDVTSADPAARGQLEAQRENAEAAPAQSAPGQAAQSQTPPGAGILSADASRYYTGRLISLDLQDADIDNALRIIAEVSNLNIITGPDVVGKVTLRLIDVPWDQALEVILRTNGLDQVREGNVVRIAPVEKLRNERQMLRESLVEPENLEQLRVEYLRVSYARATEIQNQVQSVLSERGSVVVDERTNQLVVRDIQKGLAAAKELVGRLDLRTPQILLETQIIEAQNGILRDLGFQWGFKYDQSPATGNPTGYVFPNSVGIGGGVGGSAANDAAGTAVSFPAAISATAGSAVSMVLDSADGSRTLVARLTALEEEGRAQVISRPQVATVNNKPAQIKSVETLRIRTPDSGTTVGVGQSANASGGGADAFEEIEVGITLDVVPQASPDFYVLLDIQAKSSLLGTEIVDGIPSTIDRVANSTVLVKSSQTFALGGVYRTRDLDAESGVPFLKDIPFLGYAFRRNLTDKKDEELIFFVTPHIIEGSFDESLVSRIGQVEVIDEAAEKQSKAQQNRQNQPAEL